MARILKTYSQKSKNKRVNLAFDEKTDSFIVQLKRLKQENEIVCETGMNTTVTTEIFKNKLVVTTMEMSRNAGIMLVMNFHLLFNKNKELFNELFNL